MPKGIRIPRLIKLNILKISSFFTGVGTLIRSLHSLNFQERDTETFRDTKTRYEHRKNHSPPPGVQEPRRFSQCDVLLPSYLGWKTIRLLRGRHLECHTHRAEWRKRRRWEDRAGRHEGEPPGSKAAEPTVPALCHCTSPVYTLPSFMLQLSLLHSFKGNKK